MHTTRNEIWSDKPLSVADPVLVRIAGKLRPAGLGDFPLHLPTAVPGILLRHLPRVSVALVAGRGPWVALRGMEPLAIHRAPVGVEARETGD